MSEVDELSRFHAALAELERELVTLRSAPVSRQRTSPRTPPTAADELLTVAESLAIFDQEIARIQRAKGRDLFRDFPAPEPLPDRLPDGAARCSRSRCPEPAVARGLCQEHITGQRAIDHVNQKRARARRTSDRGYCVECWDDHPTVACPSLAPRRPPWDREDLDP